MYIEVLQAKIHRATVTADEIDYEGSLTIDPVLIEAAGLLIHQKISVWNVSNGNRFETYVIEGERDSGDICVNGAAAHRARKGNIVIVAAFAWIKVGTKPPEPRVVRVDAGNRLLAERSPERWPGRSR